jgi:type I restriction enzyme M protein
MRKSLGSKRQEISDDGIALITRTFGDFAAVASYRLDGASATLVMGEDEPDEDEPGELDPGEDGEAAAGSPDAAMTGSRGRPSAKKKAEKKRFGSKIFASHEFGYRRLTIERPLRLSVQLSDERLAGLRFAPGPLNAAMQAIAQRALHWSAPASSTSHAVTSAPHVDEAEIRALIKADFSDLKEAQIKELLDPKTWRAQQELLAKARTLQRALGSDPCDDFNAFDSRLTQALKATDTKLDAKERKQFLDAVSWTNPAAAPVIKRVIKGPATPLYGAFVYHGQVVEFQPPHRRERPRGQRQCRQRSVLCQGSRPPCARCLDRRGQV